MKICLLIFFICTSNLLLAQSTYNGKIIDSQTIQELAYVNIGIIGKNIGTVSDLDGKFDIEFDESYNQDTLRISMVGYKTKDYVIAEFKKLIAENAIIGLVQKSVNLQEIVISSRNLKTKVLGNKTTSQFMSAGFSENKLGNEIGIKIKIKKSPTYIKDFNVSIVKNEFDTVRFRLNFYSIKKGLPNELLNSENIIVETSMKNGILTVDLEKYNIVVKENFFVTMEWIEDFGDIFGLSFSSNMFGKKVAIRNTSQGNWAKTGLFSIGINVTAEY